MIFLTLYGGLGNQLFQYAFAYHLAKLSNTRIIINHDIENYKSRWGRDFALQHFSIPSLRTVRHKASLPVRALRKLRAAAGIPKKQPQHVVEQGLEFHPELLAPYRGNVFVDGHWQDERYFAAVAADIRAIFRVSIPPSAANARLLETIQSVNAVSLHVRRGDYLKPAAHAVHGVCDAAYYKAAVELVASKTISPHFFVFSDDIAWARENLALHPAMHFVDINDEAAAYEDLRLMYSCKHHITANSSFSWWGAWLNPRADKIVVAPKQWKADPVANHAQRDIVPASWIKL